MSAIKPRTAVVDIYQGDYVDRLRNLEQRHKAALAAEKATPLRNGEIPESQTIADEHAALFEQAEATKISIKLGALARKGWRSLVAEHPPRKGNAEDEGMSVNEETLREVLVPLSILSITPGEVTVEDLDDIADVDYDRLYLTAFALNRSSVTAPKALPSPDLRESTKSDAT